MSPTSTVYGSLTPTSVPSSASQRKLLGPIIGGAVGGIVALLLISLIIYLRFKGHRTSSANAIEYSPKFQGVSVLGMSNSYPQFIDPFPLSYPMTSKSILMV